MNQADLFFSATVGPYRFIVDVGFRSVYGIIIVLILEMVFMMG